MGGRLPVTLGSSPDARRRAAWDRLERQVTEANPDVQDTLDLAACFESLGWTDARVEDVFGAATVFDLAEEMLPHLRQDFANVPLPTEARSGTGSLVQQVFRDLIHGVTFTLPTAVGVLAILLLHISFNAYLYFSVEKATALALAMFLSFIVTGGFTQAMSATYYILIGLQQEAEVMRTLFRMMRWGLLGAIIVSALILFLDAVFPLLPLGLAIFMVLYTVLLSALWLGYATLYVLRREYLLTLITLGAVGVAYVAWNRGYPIIVGQLVGMGAASVVSTLLAGFLFYRAQKRTKRTRRAIKTRMSQLVYASSSYFLYGLLYFAFIFADRLIAWSTNTVYMPYSIWFRGQYELGMDWSLGTLIIPLAIIDVLITVLMRWLTSEDQTVSEKLAPALGARFRSRYVIALALCLGAGTAGLLITHEAAALAVHSPVFASAVPDQGVEPMVFDWASAAYVLLALALLNVLILFTLGFPQPALRAMMSATAVDLAVGMVVTRLFNDYQFAVFGLLAGAVFLLLVTTRELARSLPKVDFLLYRLS